MSKKVMISQPMAGKTDLEIAKVRKKATQYLEDKGFEVVNTFFKEGFDRMIDVQSFDKSIYFLAKSIEKMSECQAVYFCRGWENTRGCQIEHEVAKKYGLEIIYESKSKTNTWNSMNEVPREEHTTIIIANKIGAHLWEMNSIGRFTCFDKEYWDFTWEDVKRVSSSDCKWSYVYDLL